MLAGAELRGDALTAANVTVDKPPPDEPDDVEDEDEEEDEDELAAAAKFVIPPTICKLTAGFEPVISRKYGAPWTPL